MMNTIPKIIHYCWVGGKEKSKEFEAYLASWKKYLPDYQIIEWNEKNFDIEGSCSYVKDAYEKQKWAFVTDYMRLSVLYQYGGIYLDTDVEIKKNFDDLLCLPSFMCFECSFAVCTAVIGANKEARWIKELLDLYENRPFILDNGKLDTTPNSKYIFEYFVDQYGSFTTIERNYVNEEITIFPSYYFSPINYATGEIRDTKNSYAIHYYSGTWKSKSKKIKDKLLAFVTRIIGEKARAKITKVIKGK